MASDDDEHDLQVSTRSFNWRDVKPGSWPRRLVHIGKTLTSLERQEGNVYGIDKEPKYGILTYTWGRFPGTNEPSINISGTTWVIPAVSAQHFTAKSFERAVRRIGEDVAYVWIDIACIDQEDEAIKMDEIKNQVAIFANAHRVYVWLSTLTNASLTGIFNDIFSCEMFLHSQDEEALGKSVPQAYRDLSASLSSLFKDPWFSSLWTLQEGTLRSDVLILSKEALPIRHPTIPTTLNIFYGYLLNAFWHVRSASIEALVRKTLPGEERLAHRVSDQIRLAGFDHAPFSRNPNIQYGAARRRETTRPLDRIFGIMAIYGISLGTSKEKENDFDALEHDFANAVNAKSPRLGQLFVHTEKPRPGCTWKITQCCRVTNEFGNWESNGQDSCKISATQSIGAVCEGPTCQLRSLLAVWDHIRAPPPGDNQGSFWCKIRVDDYIHDEHPSLPRLEDYPFELSWENRDRFWPLGSALLEEFGEESIIVLKLGEQAIEMARWAVLGLLLLRIDDSKGSHRRLGTCQWEKNIFTKFREPDWMHQQGVIC